ncbi:MAG: hypothetical protein Q7S51_10175 [Gallionellaceae bacterium]|nr:hypothetical protein [Gallionellaceae bacterium]
MDIAKVRREMMRWNIILTLNNARPIGAAEELVLSVVQAISPDATQIEVRRELDYLEERGLVKIQREPSGHWRAELTRWGVDLAEYTADCDPGIARPAKYWS